MHNVCSDFLFLLQFCAKLLGSELFHMQNRLALTLPLFRSQVCTEISVHSRISSPTKFALVRSENRTRMIINPRVFCWNGSPESWKLLHQISPHTKKMCNVSVVLFLLNKLLLQFFVEKECGFCGQNINLWHLWYMIVWYVNPVLAARSH